MKGGCASARKRRKHPDFRPRNPTLGETGGLPRSALTNPRSPPPKAMEASQSITRRSASNLALAFVLLPRAKRQGMSALYAFCREVDDVADDEAMPVEERRRRLAEWRADVERACSGGTPQKAVNRELQPYIAKHRLPSPCSRN